MGIETYGAYGPQGIKLVKKIGEKIQEATGEKLSPVYSWDHPHSGVLQSLIYSLFNSTNISGEI